MSRSMTPPSTLSKDDVRKIADLRRDIWTNAFYGMGVGSCSGLVLHALTSVGNRRKLWNVPISRNTLVASIMLGGTMGSFLMATTTGKNEVHNIHSVFERGARPNPPSLPLSPSEPTSSYQESLQRAKKRETDLRTLERRRTLSNRPTLPIAEDLDEVSVERVQRERNRLFRRASLSRQLEGQHGGLSDSHGGRWVKEDGPAKK